MSAAMPGFRQFVAIEAVAVMALFIVAGAPALFGFVDSAQHREVVAGLWFLGTAVFGAPFVLLFGAPAYWVLVRNEKATWLPVLAVGVAPGALILLVDMTFGLLSVGCGAAVAALTHWWCGKFVLTRGPG